MCMVSILYSVYPTLSFCSNILSLYRVFKTQLQLTTFVSGGLIFSMHYYITLCYYTVELQLSENFV